MHSINNADIAMSNKSSNASRTASKSLFARSENGATQLKSKWFAKHKKDFGNPKKASLYIGIYFLLCFLVLLCFAIIDHNNIDEKYFDHTHHIYASFFTNLQLTEIAFITMCYVPFITALIFTFRIWSLSECWRIRQEIITIFILASIIFLIDSLLTGWIYFDESTRFTLKLIIEGVILCWTTLISTVFVTCYIIKQRNKSQRKITNMTNYTMASSKELKDSNNIKSNISSLIHENEMQQTQDNIIPLNDANENININHCKVDSLMSLSDCQNNSFKNYYNSETDEIPLGYILANQLGYLSFLQHCSEEFNMENLLFLAHVCYFKKKFLDRIKDRQLLQNAKIKKHTKLKKESMNNANDRDNLPTLTEQNSKDLLDENEAYENENDTIELQSIATKTVARSRNGSSKYNLDLNSLMGDSKTSFVTIRTDVAVYSDNCDENTYDSNNIGHNNRNENDNDMHIDWSPSNCLAILTFRMCHNFERENDRLTLIDCDSNNYLDSFIEKREKRIEIALHELATNLYNKFVKENSEYEINLPAKIKRKLMFFFHQNFQDLENKNDMQYNEYRLFHIFDKSWEEIWHLLTLNSYRRFLNSNHYMAIKHQLQIALGDEKPSIYRLIVLDSNNDKHIATLIESHNPYKRKQILSDNNNSLNTQNTLTVGASDNSRLNSLNIEEMHDLKPTSLINIGVDPLPIAEQIHHFGKTMTRVKKARV